MHFLMEDYVVQRDAITPHAFRCPPVPSNGNLSLMLCSKVIFRHHTKSPSVIFTFFAVPAYDTITLAFGDIGLFPVGKFKAIWVPA